MRRILILSPGVVLLLVLRRTLWQRIAPPAAQSGGDYHVEWSVVGSAGEQFAAGVPFTQMLGSRYVWNAPNLVVQSIRLVGRVCCPPLPPHREGG